MKQSLSLLFLLVAALTVTGCVDDLYLDAPNPLSLDESDIIDSRLSLSVSPFNVATRATDASNPDHELPTDDSEEMTAFEQQVDNIWLFQYDGDGTLLIRPRYYTAESCCAPDGAWDVVLKPVSSTVYVVANVNSDTWAVNEQEFATRGALLAATLPFPQPITDVSADATTGHIPMQGHVEGANPLMGDITISVEHMYAKMKMRVLLDSDLDVYYAYLKYLDVTNIPWYCRVSSLYEGDATNHDGDYPTGTSPEGEDWISRSFTTESANNLDDPYNEQFEEDGFTYDYVIYFPENIHGEVAGKTSDDKDDKGTGAPSHACAVVVDIGYIDEAGIQESAVYTVYPGGNEYNNYNLRRNQVYRVTVDIGYPLYPANQPSANCIVGQPGTTISFEPYYRVETGGGYSITDYLNYNDPTKTPQGFEILWQTEQCIGDNSKHDKVWMEVNTENPLYSKVYVTVNQPGNAVVAAYANADCTGDILWSWHIWVTEEDPTNIGHAIVYYTYDWDEDGIYGEDSGHDRVPGYGCMPCNLGALASSPDDAQDHKIFGMNYQWGRKDPFPPMNTGDYNHGHSGPCVAYTVANVQQLYDNSHKATIMMTATEATGENELFCSISGNTIVANSDVYDVDYTIKHPTQFLCGAYYAGNTDFETADESGYSYGNANAYHNAGDWLPVDKSDNKLWGALEITDDMKKCTVNSSSGIHLYDDYGTKSIYDPCPYGWRVSPPDQWLGFTKTGNNPSSYAEINTVPDESNTNYGYGLLIYIQDWKTGTTSFFPTPGPRIGNGCGFRQYSCGNYHNATADTNNRVNILHIHDNSSNFKIFETSYGYTRKSVAGPIRCVRDTK